MCIALESALRKLEHNDNRETTETVRNTQQKKLACAPLSERVDCRVASLQQHLDAVDLHLTHAPSFNSTIAGIQTLPRIQ
jgi:hypothetical protein